MAKKKLPSTISWNRYCQDSWYSDNVRAKRGRPEFKIMKITNTNKYSLMIENEEINYVRGIGNAMQYFEQVLKDRDVLMKKEKLDAQIRKSAGYTL